MKSGVPPNAGQRPGSLPEVVVVILADRPDLTRELLERTSRGRVATPLAYQYLGRSWPDKTSPDLDQGRFSGF